MRQTVLLRFTGTAAPVELSGCPELRGYIRSILPHWPAEESRAREGCVPPFLTIDKADGKYRLSSVFMEREKSYRDLVDAVCSLVVELAWASLRSNPDWLCVHGAAVEFDGRLVLFPSARKAGKSTLTACLAAARNQIFPTISCRSTSLPAVPRREYPVAWPRASVCRCPKTSRPRHCVSLRKT